MRRKPFDQVVEEMQRISTSLAYKTYPKVSELEDQIISVLKQRFIFVDGYQVAIQLNRSDYDDYFLETLEIMPMHFPFLPMYLVCKIAAKFLGGHHLHFSHAYQDGHKIYIWNVKLDRRGRPLPLDGELQKYGDFEFLNSN